MAAKKKDQLWPAWRDGPAVYLVTHESAASRAWKIRRFRLDLSMVLPTGIPVLERPMRSRREALEMLNGYARKLAKKWEPCCERCCCTAKRACQHPPDGERCHWVKPGLCSACVPPGRPLVRVSGALRERKRGG